MPNDIAQGPDFLPGLIRHEKSGHITELDCRFTNSLQTAFNSIIGFAILLESFQIHSLYIPEDRMSIFDDVL